MTTTMATAQSGPRTARSLRLAATVTALLLTVGAAAAHEGATGVLAEPMALMKAMGQHMKTLGGMIGARTPFDPATARHVAEAMQEHCQRMGYTKTRGS